MQLHLLTQQEAHKKQPQQSVELQRSGVVAPPCIHFVETASSVLREMPWVQLKEHKVQKNNGRMIELIVNY